MMGDLRQSDKVEIAQQFDRAAKPPLSDREAFQLRLWLPLGAFAVLWIDLCWQLSYIWRDREQYSYGWSVPLLALGLAWQQWESRPAAVAAKPPVWVTACVVVVAALMLPLRVIHEINQDWPLITWPLTMGVVVLTLYVIYQLGGWRWVWHFGFAIAFILTAVAWPYQLENGITQGLQRLVVAFTIEIMGFLGIPAIQQGNLIEIGSGTLGVDEACSGIRSFQFTFMCALFFGELYRLSKTLRVVLLFGGWIVAFAFNILRAVILSLRAVDAGTEGVDAWHDPVGLTIWAASFVCVWGAAVLMNKWLFSSRDEPQSSTVPGSGESYVSVLKLATSRVTLTAIGGWWILGLSFTQLWYWSGQSDPSQAVRWSVSMPTSRPGFRNVPVTAQVAEILGHDSGLTGSWREDDGTDWTVYFFRWEPTSMQNVIKARGHRPDVCLPASGLRQTADDGVDYFKVGNLSLPFRRFTFETGGRTLHVFFCLWADGDEEQRGIRRVDLADRLQWVLFRRRLMGQQTMELILAGYPTATQAEKAVQRHLEGLIKLNIDSPRGGFPDL